MTALRAENIELREALARVTAEREAARAVAFADVAAAKRVAEAEIAAQIAASLTKEAVLRELVTELKAMLDEARRPVAAAAQPMKMILTLADLAGWASTG